MDADAQKRLNINPVEPPDCPRGRGGEGEAPLGVLKRGIGIYTDRDAGRGCWDEIDNLGGGVGSYQTVDEVQDGGGVDEDDVVVGEGDVAALREREEEATSDDEPGTQDWGTAAGRGGGYGGGGGGGGVWGLGHDEGRWGGRRKGICDSQESETGRSYMATRVGFDGRTSMAAGLLFCLLFSFPEVSMHRRYGLCSLLLSRS